MSCRRKPSMETENEYTVLPAFNSWEDKFKKYIILRKIMSTTVEMKTLYFINLL